MSIAYCIYKINQLLQSKIKTHSAKKYVTFFVYYGFLILIFILNFYNYFYVYPQTLPNGNTPFGKLIAQTIDATAPNTHVIIVGAGWGQYYQPEVMGIPMVQKTVHQENFVTSVVQTQQSLCQNKRPGTPVFIASDPTNQQQLETTNLCLNKTKSYMLTANGWNVAYIVEGTQ